MSETQTENSKAMENALKKVEQAKANLARVKREEKQKLRITLLASKTYGIISSTYTSALYPQYSFFSHEILELDIPISLRIHSLNILLTIFRFKYICSPSSIFTAISVYFVLPSLLFFFK